MSRPAVFRYFMIAMCCFIVAKTAVRIVHYANPTAFGEARIF